MFATQPDLIEWCGINATRELTQLTDPSNVAIDANLIAAKLSQADNIINSRLVGIALPLASPYPPLIVDTACAIARRLLYKYGAPEHVETDYRDALAFLDKVRKGEATLGLDSTGTAEAVQSSGYAVIASEKTFTDDVLGVL